MIMSGVAKIRHLLKSRIQNANSAARAVFERIEKKSEGTFTENWFKFWKNVYIDYKEVAVDVVKDVREKPLKATGFLCIMGLTTYLAKCNPSEAEYRSAVISAANDISLVSSSLRKSEAVEHLRFIERCYNQDLVRRLNLGILSIMWIDKHNRLYKNYETECQYLTIPFRQYQDRVLDIGFLNKWWLLSKKLEDYDVNY